MSASLDCAAMIAADMRNLADDIADGRAIVGQSVWRSYADRVESVGTGNVAKMREAAEAARSFVVNLEIEPHSHLDDVASELLARIDAALAAPERNCDKAKVGLDLYKHFRAPEGMREMPPEWVDAIASFCNWVVASEQKLDPKVKYSVTNFKLIADFGAASTHGGHSCIHCKNCQGYSECNHPCLQKPFKLGTHADRMGCRNGWEAANDKAQKKQVRDPSSCAEGRVVRHDRKRCQDGRVSNIKARLRHDREMVWALPDKQKEASRRVLRRLQKVAQQHDIICRFCCRA